VQNTHMYTPPSEDQRSISELADTVRKRLWIVFLVTLILVGVTVAVSFLQPPVYGASALVHVGQAPGVDALQNLDGTLTGLQTLTYEVAAAGVIPNVADKVSFGLKQQGVTQQDLNSKLTIEQLEDTRYLEFSYTDTNPGITRAVVNDVVDAYVEQIPKTNYLSTPITATVTSYATEPKVRGPDPIRNRLVALAVGLMLGVAFAFLLGVLDRRWRSTREVERAAGVPTFGVIPKFDKAEENGRKVSFRR
jgi:capsular polysaccharide biosynthesis protein